MYSMVHNFYIDAPQSNVFPALEGAFANAHMLPLHRLYTDFPHISLSCKSITPTHNHHLNIHMVRFHVKLSDLVSVGGPHS